jgi:hypothetical protein
VRHRRNAETGKGRVKPLAGVFEGLLRLRVGNHRNDTRQNTAVAPGHIPHSATGEKTREKKP